MHYSSLESYRWPPNAKCLIFEHFTNLTILFLTVSHFLVKKTPSDFVNSNLTACSIVTILVIDGLLLRVLFAWSHMFANL